ncbi:MAG: DUF479 domain-containing protein [Gammaproteobacteria bacterium]|nr:MAG: DUF479 domain-containing protein [Gammaproteobacteria bacterium]
MNHLAHAHLARAHPEGSSSASFCAGSVLGDFVKGVIDDNDWPAALADGIRFHRRIDGFTDRHPITRECRQRFPSDWRRLSGPALDVLWDHFLSRQWHDWHPAPLPAFTHQACQDMLQFAHHFPQRALPFSRWLAGDKVLDSYATPAGVEAALSLTIHRLPHSGQLAAVTRQWLATHDEWLESRFRLLYAECLLHSQR